MNILIFKNDKMGDLIHHSSTINNIKKNFVNSKIFLVCSRYNYSIAKNYKFIDKLIISDGQSAISLYLKYFKYFKKKFEFTFVLDGKKTSILTSLFVKTNARATLCYKKEKKILGFKINVFRPSLIILKLFFDYFLFSDENYKNTNISYQNLYFKLLEKCNLKIFYKQNFYTLQESEKDNYINIKTKLNLNYKFCIFHIDEKMAKFSMDNVNSIDFLINELSKKIKVIITTGIFEFKYSDYFFNKYKNYNYNDLLINHFNESESIVIIKKMPVDLLAYFLNESQANISFHAGLIVNISAALNKNIIDIIQKHKFDELNRWIPLNSKYKRYSFQKINQIIENF